MTRMSRQEIQKQRAARTGVALAPAEPKNGAPQGPRAPHERVTFGKTGATPKDVYTLAARLEAVANGVMVDSAKAVRELVERCDRFEHEVTTLEGRLARLEGRVGQASDRVDAALEPPPPPAEPTHVEVSDEGTTATYTYPPEERSEAGDPT